MADLVLVDIADGVAIVTLNRPDAMNALSTALRSALYHAMVRVDGDDAVRAVVLTGAGERAFTAGLDLQAPGSQAGSTGRPNATRAPQKPVHANGQWRQPQTSQRQRRALNGGLGRSRASRHPVAA